MSEQNILNSKAVKKFIKSTFVLFGLFVVLSYAFATVVLLSNNSNSDIHSDKSGYISSDSSNKNHRDSSAYSRSDSSSKSLFDSSSYSNHNSSMSSKNNIFTWTSVGVLALVHILVFVGIFFVVKPKYNKVCDILGVRETCLLVATPIICPTTKIGKRIQSIVLRINSRLGVYYLKDKILWVDDEPNSDICIQKVLWSYGITTEKAKTIKEAFESLKNDSNYIAIIFVKKKEDAEEEKVLKDIRAKYRKLPIITYNKEI